MTQIVEQVKERLDIAEVVEQYITLERTGRRFRALCPFHAEKTPSFYVFPDSQRWHCFGACNEGGDVFDFVQKQKGWDFSTALHELAQEAGVELKPLTPEVKARIEEQRDFEAALGVVAIHFVDRLKKTPQALAYARGRWSDKVIQAEGFGYTDGGPLPDLGNERAQQAVDALNWWAGEVHGALIYVHRDRGRTVNLSARSVEGKAHYNLKGEWAGHRQPYVNAAYKQNAPEQVIVEGQACAASLTEWDVSGRALAGSGVQGDLVDQIRRQAERGVTFYLVLDGDGKTDVGSLVEAVGPLLRVVRLPDGARDVNDWAANGGSAEAFKALLDAAPTWLEMEIDRVANVNGRGQTAERRRLFEWLVDLDSFYLADYTERVKEKLGINAGQFKNYLRAVQGEELAERRNGHNGARYVIDGGQLCAVKHGDSGPYYEPLCNFVARVTEDTARDDGSTEINREFTIAGKLATGEPLPSVQVSAAKFSGMGWITDVWGIKAVLRAGWRTRDLLREAIQVLSEDVQSRYVYTHTGWRVIGGDRVYLHAGGSLGKEGVAVDLEKKELARYCLPNNPQDIVGAMRASLRFLHVAPYTVTAPLWAAAFLAPLTELLKPNFALWLYGVTGTLKSTLAALILSHFGEFTHKTLPESWETTANALEMTCFKLKDVLLVIDDYAPQSNPRKARDLEGTVERLVRSLGNLSARGRLNPDLTQRPAHPPRCLVLSTGEQLPSGQSLTARMYTVEMSPGDIDLEQLSAAQAEAARYPHAMTGYLGWLRNQWDNLKEDLPRFQAEQRQKLREEMNESHLRIPDILATLYLGFDLGMAYAEEVGALTTDEAQELRARGWEALKEGALSQGQRVEQERPTVLFFDVIVNLLAQERARLETLDGQKRIGGERGELLGWCDEQYVYILPASYNTVTRFLREEGKRFPVPELTLRKHLEEEGYLERGLGQEANRRVISQWIPSRQKNERVLRLRRTMGAVNEIISPPSE